MPNQSNLPNESACGTKREEYLAHHRVPAEDGDELWGRKLDLDGRINAGTQKISLQVVGDIEPFVSTVDKSIINSRSTLREHNLKHDVTNTQDFKGVWETAEKQRAEYREKGHVGANREEIARIFNQGR